MERQRAIVLGKRICFVTALLPLARLLWLGASDGLGANPVEFVIRSNGTWALTFLLLTLAATPLRLLLGQPWPLQFRRMLGLYAFFYACLHVLCYVGVDQWFDWQAIGKDIVKHPFIMAGFSGFVLMVPLAATSNKAMMTRLKRRWQMLHRLVYPIAMLGVLHYFWLVKKDITQPMIYAVLLAILLGVRLVKWGHPALTRILRQRAASPRASQAS